MDNLYVSSNGPHVTRLICDDLRLIGVTVCRGYGDKEGGASGVVLLVTVSVVPTTQI